LHGDAPSIAALAQILKENNPGAWKLKKQLLAEERQRLADENERITKERKRKISLASLA